MQYVGVGVSDIETDMQHIAKGRGHSEIIRNGSYENNCESGT